MLAECFLQLIFSCFLSWCRDAPVVVLLLLSHLGAVEGDREGLTGARLTMSTT